MRTGEESERPDSARSDIPPSDTRLPYTQIRRGKIHLKSTEDIVVGLN